MKHSPSCSQAPSGELPRPPTEVHWKPGTPGALAQVVFHRATFEFLWSSPPLQGVDRLELPRGVFDQVGAGLDVFWRVRELRDGEAVGSSDYLSFGYLVDSHGFGPGEGPAGEELMQ
jgi:hypothetical protein